jgi:hypothetical protein
VSPRRQQWEAKEAEAYVQWFAVKFPQWTQHMWHNPNERANAVEAKRLSAQGVVPGVPDYTIAVACRGFHGCYLELKRTGARPSSVSQQQIDKIDILNRAGYYARACFGLDEMIERTTWYLSDAHALPR